MHSNVSDEGMLSHYSNYCTQQLNYNILYNIMNLISRLKDYPPEVPELCIKFLQAIAEKINSKTVVKSISDVIVCQ